MGSRFFARLKEEFAGYNKAALGADAVAGMTVVAVSLPLALAFGVSSGGDAAAGLISAILAGLIISGLSGASYQIAGPTGTMMAILTVVAARHTVQGVFIVTLLAGAVLLLAGLLQFGKLISLIPLPVVCGFTSGIALMIILGQVDAFFGVSSEGATVLQKLVSYFRNGFSPDSHALLIGVFVLVVMVFWPKKWNRHVPSSLAAIVLATALSAVLGLDGAKVGAIPRTLLPAARLDLAAIEWGTVLQTYLSPALSCAALIAVESLLCGASASRMKNESFDPDQQLVAQGVGNLIIPFFGGVPAASALARTSVAIRSGGRTRMTGIFSAFGLIGVLFLLGDLMAEVPLAALAGVLVVSAARMNDWENIRYIFRKRFKAAITAYLLTMVCTIVFDLNVAILSGVAFAAVVFVYRQTRLHVTITEFDSEDDKLDATVVTIDGVLFFANVETLKRELAGVNMCERLVIAMRGVPSIDLGGAQALNELLDFYQERGTAVSICGAQRHVHDMLMRTDTLDLLPDARFFNTVDQALTVRVGV
ncbi:MAG: sulfate permease [Clostridium sp. SCN 57-10]|nr:MAG: sulfate permease [Clostridium sp. SCN 57-10]